MFSADNGKHSTLPLSLLCMREGQKICGTAPQGTVPHLMLYALFFDLIRFQETISAVFAGIHHIDLARFLIADM